MITARYAYEHVSSKVRPVLLVAGSLTCPMTASSNPILKELHASFGSRIEFASGHRNRRAYGGSCRWIVS